MRELIRDGHAAAAGALAAAWMRAAAGASLRIGAAYDPRTLIDESASWGPAIETSDEPLAGRVAPLLSVLTAAPYLATRARSCCMAASHRATSSSSQTAPASSISTPLAMAPPSSTPQ